MSEIEIEDEGNTFWVLVGENLVLYDDKNEAIMGLKEEMSDGNEDATVAEVSYTASDEEDEQGTFNVNAISWKEVAMGWVD